MYKYLKYKKKYLELQRAGTVRFAQDTSNLVHNTITIIPETTKLPVIRKQMNICHPYSEKIDFNRHLITDTNLNSIWHDANSKVNEFYQTKEDLGLSYTVKFFKLPWTEPTEITKYIIIENNRVVKLWAKQDRVRFNLDVKVALYYSTLGFSTPLQEYGEVTINGILFNYMIFTKITHTDDYFTLRKNFYDGENKWNTFKNYLYDNTNEPVQLTDGGNVGVDDCGRWFNYDNDMYAVRGDILSSKERSIGNKKKSSKIGSNPKKAIYYYYFDQPNTRHIIRS